MMEALFLSLKAAVPFICLLAPCCTQPIPISLYLFHCKLPNTRGLYLSIDQSCARTTHIPLDGGIRRSIA